MLLHSSNHVLILLGRPVRVHETTVTFGSVLSYQLTSGHT